MIGRIVWIVAIAAIASVTGAAQLDRQSRYVPALAHAVPEPFRAFAQAHVASAEAETGDPARALAEAQKLVARRPMPAEHLRLLSIAEFKDGQAEQGGYSIQLAARRGWRDPVSQKAMLQLALAADDKPEAARRFAALFIGGSEDQDALQVMAQSVFSGPGAEAQVTYSLILAGADRWHRIFLRRGPRVFEPAVFLDLVDRAQKGGASFDCEQLNRASQILASQDAQAAETLKARMADSC